MINSILVKRGVVLGLVLVATVLAVAVVTSSALALNTHSVVLEESLGQYFVVSSTTPAGLNLIGDFTIEAWIKPTSILLNEPMEIVSKDGSGQRGYGFGMNGLAGGLYVFFVDSLGNVSQFETTNLEVTNTDQWYHVAVTVDSSVPIATFYVNGSPVATSIIAANALSINDNAASFRVGPRDTDPIYFDGGIDEVRVWDAVRNATDITNNRSVELTGAEQDLVGYWKFNNSLADETSNNNDLANVGGFQFSSDRPFDNVPPFAELLRVKKPLDEQVVNSTTLQDDDTLVLSLKANTTYIIDGVVFASAPNGTPDILVSFLAQPGSEVVLGYTNDVSESVLNSGETSPRIQLQGNTQTSVHVHGTVVTGSTEGPFTLRWAQATANLNNPTSVLQGSYLRAEQI